MQVHQVHQLTQEDKMRLLHASNSANNASFLSSTVVRKSYEVLTGSNQSTAKWEAQCNARGGTLASINSASEQAAAKIAMKGRNVITGMRRVKPNNKVFINGAGRKLTYR